LTPREVAQRKSAAALVVATSEAADVGGPTAVVTVGLEDLLFL
jgi:hypothetical protein